MNLQLIIENIINKYDVQTCDNYGEPGYDNNGKQILLANWNPIYDKYPNIANYLDEVCCIEWSDEWIISYETNTCFRCQPNSYHWQPSYIILNECEVFGVNEVFGNIDMFEAWIESEFVNNTNNAINTHVSPSDNLIKLGFEFVPPTHYNGLHKGMNADPVKIYEQYMNEHDCIFVISEQSQFYIGFDLYIRRK